MPIENDFKRFCPGLSNVMMVGDKKKFIVCLVTIKTKPLPDGSFGDELDGEAVAVDSACVTVAQAKKSAKWKAYIDAGCKKANAEAVSRAARIQKWTILDTDFSVPGGELTATLKTRRNVVSAKYNDIIEAMYEGANE